MSSLAKLAEEARLDAKAFRENTVYDSEGDPIRLVANANRLDAYAAALATAGAEAAELRAVLADRDALWKVLHDATCIIGHTVPMETVVLAGRKLVAREVWQAAHDLLYPKATRGTPHE